MKHLRRISGLAIAAVGATMLAAVACEIFVCAREQALQYLGFGIIFGLMLVATGAAVSMPSDTGS
ncbi:hypothetical protein HFO56_24725 [Rhizobium laguerreae]|uniref:hypothetical protein n=1 Tax=Rhizobium laguerreae TaxID=1076926 RepID=UPI001C9109BA|nr:hypothetical protein [Rhizobium laguerreae]MBY3155535.1 hypothetical protein [Rhizobium laguerreae]MBY3433799.1 hypothetical protein [Rhizobium laguerreae]